MEPFRKLKGSKKEFRVLTVALIDNSVCIHYIWETVLIIETLFISFGKERDTTDGTRQPRSSSGGPRWFIIESKVLSHKFFFLIFFSGHRGHKNC